jgi:hypothetical protein
MFIVLVVFILFIVLVVFILFKVGFLSLHCDDLLVSCEGLSMFGCDDLLVSCEGLSMFGCFACFYSTSSKLANSKVSKPGSKLEVREKAETKDVVEEALALAKIEDLNPLEIQALE